MASKAEENDVVRVDFAFKRELAEKVEGDLASFCYQCGACVGDCPASTYSDGAFNPRELMLMVLYGLGDELRDLTNGRNVSLSDEDRQPGGMRLGLAPYECAVLGSVG